MAYNPANDFVGLWRAQTGGAVKAEMPGLDFVMAALNRAGAINVVISNTAPTSNQDTTAWFKPTTPSYQGEGTLYLWGGVAYTPATPALWADYLTSWGVGDTGIVAAPSKNYIINGAMMVNTEQAAGSVNGTFPVDMFSIQRDAGSAGLHSAGQVTLMTPGGSPNRLRISVNTADTSIISTDAYWIETKIENIRLGDLYWNGASYPVAQARPVTLQFGVRALLAGTYSIAILNNPINNNYVGEYTISAGEINTDVVKTVVIPAPTFLQGWNTSGASTTGMFIRWALACGTTYQATPGTWGTSTASIAGSTNQVNMMNSAANTLDLFDVSLTEGTTCAPYKVTDYATELARCQRYFQMRLNQTVEAVATSINLLTPMRINPVITGGGGGFTVNVNDPISPQVSQTTRGSTALKFNARL